MAHSILVCLAALIAVTSAIDLSANTDFKLYFKAMLGKPECAPITKTSKISPVGGKSCGGASCNYPNQVCVSDNEAGLFETRGVFKCENVPDACMAAVRNSDVTASGGGGGSATPRPNAPTPAPTQRATTTPAPTPRPSTNSCPKCGTPACTAPQNRGTLAGGFKTQYYFANCKCTSFVYLGAGGNENRYASQADCLAACGATQGCGSSSPSSGSNKCALKAKAGAFERTNPITCPAAVGRGTAYSFNSATRKCESFFYLGCQGNDNRFASQAECTAQCGG
jgi:hypothetical protein